MSRKKLQRIQEAMVLPNIIQYDDPEAKRRVTDFLSKERKTFLELGCGRGEYTLGLAQMFLQVQCLGVDIQGERMWHGAKEALRNKRENVLFLRTQIGRVEECISPHSIDEIWLPFPDPFPRKKQAKKRLTSPRFLEIYTKLLKPNGVVHLKTDNENILWYTKKTTEAFGGRIIKFQTNVAELTMDDGNPLSIQTQYEKRYRAQERKIFYLAFIV